MKNTKEKIYITGLRKVLETGNIFLNEVKKNEKDHNSFTDDEMKELEEKWKNDKKLGALSDDLNKLWNELEDTL